MTKMRAENALPNGKLDNFSMANGANNGLLEWLHWNKIGSSIKPIFNIACLLLHIVIVSIMYVLCGKFIMEKISCNYVYIDLMNITGNKR